MNMFLYETQTLRRAIFQFVAAIFCLFIIANGEAMIMSSIGVFGGDASNKSLAGILCIIGGCILYLRVCYRIYALKALGLGFVSFFIGIFVAYLIVYPAFESLEHWLIPFFPLLSVVEYNGSIGVGIYYLTFWFVLNMWVDITSWRRWLKLLLVFLGSILFLVITGYEIQPFRRVTADTLYFDTTVSAVYGALIWGIGTVISSYPFTL